MAFILLNNRQPRFVTAIQGATIWRVMNKEIKGTKEQQAFVKQIKMLYLNRENAPKSYLERYPLEHEKKTHRQPVTQGRLPYSDS